MCRSPSRQYAPDAGKGWLIVVSILNVRFAPILLQKSFCEVALKFSDPQVQRLNNDVGDHVAKRQTHSDSGNAFEALLIGDCRLFRSLAEN